MNQTESASRRIHILRDSVAQRIAAGEVIDRPFSVIRELLDNSIDAGADSIDIHIEEGGIKHIRVIDNGRGMDRSDLELCYLPHATSKIHTAEDIYRLQTLGFRGEALSSMAACSKLLITSSTGTDSSHTLEIRNGTPIRLELSGGSRGTAVTVSDLFYSMPGRRRFLKSPGAEGAACFRTFLEKALPFPDIQFRFFNSDTLKLFLPGTDRKHRILQAFPSQFTPDFLHQLTDEAGAFRLEAVFTSPSIKKRDRRYIHIYVNGRRIQEYSLVQAVQYAYDEILPGGSFPAAFIFLDVDPELVDFNIHPAKREAKIKNLKEIHHQIVQSLKSYLNSTFLIPDSGSTGFFGKTAGIAGEKEGRRKESGGSLFHTGQSVDYLSLPVPDRQDSAERASSGYGHTLPAGKHGGPSSFSIDIGKWKGYAGGTESFRPGDKTDTPVQSPAGGSVRYIGQLFNLFLLAERDEQLFLIDQHAAHERILYDAIVDGPRNSQQLLVPHEFDIEPELEVFVEDRLEEYRKIGIHIGKTGENRWRITHLPERFSGLEGEIVQGIREQSLPKASFQSKLFADLACKAAVRDGEVLDTYSAEALVEKALSLPIPRCPHGRPIWLKISREELFQAVGRT